MPVTGDPPVTEDGFTDTDAGEGPAAGGLISQMKALSSPFIAPLLVAWIGFFVGKSVEPVDPVTQAFPCPSIAIPLAQS